MDTKKYGLTEFQWAAIVICTVLGSGIVTLPRTVAETAGRDGWLSIILAGTVTCGLACFIWLLCRRFPTRTLPEFSIIILGRPLGILVSVLYFLYAISLAGTSLRIFAELTKTWVLIWTPSPVFILAVLFPVVYISRMGAVSLGRMMELIIYLTVIVLLVWLAPLGEFKILNLRPVGAEGIVAIAGAAPEAIFAFLGFEVMLVFFPFIINRDTVLKVTLLALVVITALYAGNSAIIYGVLGVEHTLLQKWPLINYLRIGTLPVVQRVDSLVVFIWTAQVMAVVAIQYYAGTFTLATLTRKSHHDIWAIACWPLVYFVAMAPRNLVEILRVSDLVGYWGLGGIVSIVAILLLVAKVRGLDESKEERVQ